MTKIKHLERFLQILFNKHRANDENDEQIDGKLSGVVGMLRNDVIASFMLEFER